MTVKLLLLKSGEDIVADVKEMVVGEEENVRVIGYFLHKPCVVKMTPSVDLPEENNQKSTAQKSAFQVTLFPWMPLTKDNTIPVSADWVVTMVTPNDKLMNMYTEDVINYGKDNQSFSSTEQSDSDNPD